jgi:DNA-binding transcriptional LysR family regulator
MSTLRFFRTFLAVARHGSFAEAAEHVSLTQAGVSFQMRALETQLNQRLFERQGRQSVLTAAGRQLVPEVTALLDHYDRLCTPRRAAGEAPKAAAFGSIVSCMVPLSRSISRLKRVFPHTDIRVCSGKSAELTSLVARAELDAAIIVEHTRLPRDLRCVPLCQEPLVVITSSVVNARSVHEALALLPFLRFDRQEHTGRLVDQALRELRCATTDFLELNSMETLIDLVRQNAGVTLLPLPAHANWANDPGLRIMMLPETIATFQRRLALVIRNDYPHPTFSDTFADTCSNLFN